MTNNERRFALIGLPSSAGARQTGQETAPAALRAAGLLERLAAAGLDVADLGDTPTMAFRPDPEHGRRQNAGLVAEAARHCAGAVDRALARHRRPLVLGGDCSLTLGVVSALLRHHSRLGLLYFDADLDLNTPETTHWGVFDGMVLAHLLGRGASEVAGIGPREPLLAEEDVVLFGFDAASGWIDPPEIRALESSRLAQFPLAAVRLNPAESARSALEILEDRSDAFLLHFDVDVTSLPAADVPHPGGLDPDSAFEAFGVFATSPLCAAIVVTEFNAARDPDGSQAALLVEGLTGALTPRGVTQE